MGVKGRYLDELIKLVKQEGLEKQVRILIDPSDNVVKDILSLSKIYVFPSQWEAFGISVLEAMAQGNAIIITKTEGGRLLVKENENGFFVNYGEVDSIAERIEFLYKNKNDLERMNKNNIEKAKGFLWDKVIQKYSDEIIKG